MNTNTKILSKYEALAIAEKTADAYSYDRYRSWGACALALAHLGYDTRQIEAILRSKHMRWAADQSNNRYGQVTSSDLLRYLTQSKLSGREVEELVRGTFS